MPPKEKKAEKAAPSMPKYRYYCHACTGRAFYADEPEKFKGTRVCHNCGAEVTYEADKWIKNA
jgi:rRNA maturation endonuclease Nob1